MPEVWTQDPIGYRKAVLNLIWHDNKLWAKLWPLTDAYGPQGYVPPQGYDWSGFRDSSFNAIKAMGKVIGIEFDAWG